MLRAHLIHRTALACPACRSGDFVAYRRLPEAEGRVLNRCTCRRCGIDFEFEEDREGRPIREK